MKSKSILTLALAAGLVSAVACTEKNDAPPPPPGMAGGVGGGVNPGANANDANTWLPGAQPTAPANPHGAGGPSSAPANPHAGMDTGQPSPSGGTLAMPTVIKGDGVPPPPSASGKAVLAGTVLETMNAAGYTYMKVKPETGGEMWAAVTETKVNVGDGVSLTESLTMTDFHSKSLNRTFDRILFATLNGAPVPGGK